MSIKQYAGISVGFFGDGVATTFSVNLEAHIKLLGVLPLSPTQVYSISGLPTGMSVISTTITGSTIGVVLDSAPPASFFNATFNLLF